MDADSAVGFIFAATAEQISDPLDPNPKICLRVIADRLNVNEAFHGPPSEIHGACVRQRKWLLVRICSHSDHKIIANNAAAHVTINHECESTEHTSFRGWRFFLENVTYSLC